MQSSNNTVKIYDIRDKEEMQYLQDFIYKYNYY